MKAKLEICTSGPAPRSGASRLTAWHGVPVSATQAMSARRLFASIRQSASRTITTPGGWPRRYSRAAASAKPFPRRSGSLRSRTLAPPPRARSAVRSVQLSATTSTKAAVSASRLASRTVDSITASSSCAGMTMTAEMPGSSANSTGRSGRKPAKISTAKKPVRTATGATSTKVRIVRPIKLRPRRNSGRWTYAGEFTKANSLILGRSRGLLRFCVLARVAPPV